MTEFTAIWDKLAKTDPSATKSFKRAGGFSGTAIKPQWVVRRLTEEFGPVGVGWGMDKPEFQVVPGENREVLVFCTVQAWHGGRGQTVFGVGGDKVVTHIKANEQYNRPERWESDDEAFKKAFTDALMNAFKFVGVGSDVHMGKFDDNKYVAQMRDEFSGQAQQSADGRKTSAQSKRDGDHDKIKEELAQCGDLETLGVWGAQRLPYWLSVCPTKWEDPIRDQYDNRRNEITDADLERSMR